MFSPETRGGCEVDEFEEFSASAQQQQQAQEVLAEG
jgi:hypothetical protein